MTSAATGDQHSPAPRFVWRTDRLPAGAVVGYDRGQWRDALVVLVAGQLELERCTGGRDRYQCGAVLTLADLPLRALRNPGDAPAVLVSVRRCPAAQR